MNSAVLVLVFACLISASLCDIAGRVFRDYNYNGVQDGFEPGIPGIVMELQFEDETTETRETSENGDFQFFSTSDGDHVRLYANVGDWLFPGATTVATTSNPAFITASRINILMGFAANKDYCGDAEDLEVVVPCYVMGDQEAPGNSDLPTIVKFGWQYGTTDVNYTTGGDPNPPDDEPDKFIVATAGEVGTTWGTAWSRRNSLIFANSLTKRHSGFANGDQNTGAIYVMDRNGNSVSEFLDLDSLGFPTRGGPVHGADIVNDDSEAWDHVGKTSLGGIDLSPDDEYLFTLNLYSREVLKIPIGYPATAPTSPSGIETAATPRSLPGCNSEADARPFALTYHNGQVYIGLVCSGESTQLVSQLQAYVYKLDPVGMTFETEPVLHAPLTFRRGRIAFDSPASTRCTTGMAIVPMPGPVSQADWRPWASVISENPLGASKQCGYPQPILSDLEFGWDGVEMYLGFIDRYGHQSSNAEGANNDNLPEGVSAGDLLCSQYNFTSGIYTFEYNGVCNGHVSRTREGNSGVGNTDGPGGGEFFSDDRFDSASHQENTLGGIAVLYDVQEIMSSAFDPSPKGGVRAGGLSTFSQVDGAQHRAYVLFNQDEGGSFGKAAGVGEPVVLCGVAPLQIGSRVWNDTNNNGVQDAGEPGFPGVQVQLLDLGGNVVATEVTDANGEVWFTQADHGVQEATAYSLRVELDQAPFSGYVVSPANVGGDDELDSDGDDGVAYPGYTTALLTTGVGGQNDYSTDFGLNIGVIPTSTPPVTTPPTTTPPVTSAPTTTPPVTTPPTTTPPTTTPPVTTPPTTTPPVTTPPTTTPPVTTPPTTTPPVTTPPTTTPPVTTPPTTTPPVTTPPTTAMPTAPPQPDPKIACGDGDACSCDEDEAKAKAQAEALQYCAKECLKDSDCPIGFDAYALVMDYDCHSKYHEKCSSLCNAGVAYSVETECTCSCARCECELGLD